MQGGTHTATRKDRARKDSKSRKRKSSMTIRTRPKQTKRGRGTAGTQQFQHGFERGYTAGVNQGVESFAEPFHGTSIIIPTFNQADYLIQCVASIEAHTTDPYEIIVVDNGSTDHTGDYLQQRIGHIRFRQLETNRGFSGGVNQGLMMAKSDHIVILNNDTLVTPGWLSNMLRCLYSDPAIGVVGPVTNYISGEQQIEVPYDAVPQMWAFAQQYNVPDESRWYRTDRLVGYCLLFRRDLLQTTGYFDEGFEIGNYEDEDWMTRVRLSGRELAIAGDTFIHHYGSVSMKNLGQQKFEVVHEQNGTFYERKWGNPHKWVQQVKTLAAARNDSGTSTLRKAVDFYPTGVIIQDQSGRIYWLHQGRRFRCSEEEREDRTPVLVSMFDMRCIPEGTADDLLTAKAKHISSSPEMLKEGQLITCGDGHIYQWQEGKRRSFVTKEAVSRWVLDGSEVLQLSKEKIFAIPEGLPIIVPPVLLNPVL